MPRWRNGRRAGLKNLWGLKPHEGSTPSLGTKMDPQQLKKKLKVAEEKLLKAGKRMGEAGGSGEWHDNSAWDNAVIDFKVREEIVNSIKESIRKLKNS